MFSDSIYSAWHSLGGRYSGNRRQCRSSSYQAGADRENKYNIVSQEFGLVLLMED